MTFSDLKGNPRKCQTP